MLQENQTTDVTLKINEIFFSIQGESLLAGKPSVFVRTSECNLRCTWCLAPETPILMADFTYRPLGELVEGDEIIGVGQVPGRKHKRLVRSRVVALSRKENVERIVFSTTQGKFICTPDHKIWHTGLKENGRYGRWRAAGRFNAEDEVRTVSIPKVNPPDIEAYRLGYLAGVADGDGCFWDFAPQERSRTYLRFRLAANDLEMINRFREYGEFFGFEFSSRPHNHTGFKGVKEDLPSLFLLGGDEQVNRFSKVLFDNASYSTNDSYLRGYMGGIFDAEGSLSCNNLRISQSELNSGIRSKIFSFAKTLGFDAKIEEKGVILQGGWQEHLRFFTLCTPAISRKRNDFFIRGLRTSGKVLGTQRAEHGPVITMSTECGTFVADGVLVKNCDTKYAYWKGDLLPLSKILEEIKKHETRYVCVTGGEPLSQRGTYVLMRTLLDQGYTVSLETNGSYSIKDVPLDVIKIVDIKCPDSGMSDAMAWENFDLAKPHDQFKFVVASRKDFDWAEKICGDHKLHERCTILYSPAYGQVKPAELAKWILDSKAKVTMQMQMHKEIWGPNERGV